MDAPSSRGVAREAKPLQPLSPKRLNERAAMDRTPTQMSPNRKANLFADYNISARKDPNESVFTLTQSPSLPEIHAFRSHVRTNSDVQGLVKRFEHLDVRDRDAEFVERKKRHEAELRRAQIAREEAESDAKKLREEVRKLKKEGEEARERERKVSKRLEVVMEEFATSRDGHSTQMASYEKENRKARKEAFKSSSAVVKLQEELKATRNTLRVTQSNLEMEKLRSGQREQDAFTAQYKLAALLEEVGTLKSDITALQQEREALKSSMEKEEVARIAAEGMIALPAARADDDLLASPRRRSPHKVPASPLSDDKENAGVITKKVLEMRRLEDEVSRERALREHAEELLEFLQVECQFKCCFCRDPEVAPVLALSRELNETMENIKKEMMVVFRCNGDDPASEDEDMDKTIRPTETAEPDDDVESDNRIEPPDDIEMTSVSSDVSFGDGDTSITLAGTTPDEQFAREQAPAIEPVREALQPADIEVTDDVEVDMEESTDDTLEELTSIPAEPSSPQTPPDVRRAGPPRQRPSIRTVTTTTTIPMQFSPMKLPVRSLGDPESAPATVEDAQPELVIAPVIDREAALAAIAYRRGRAKSIANGQATPRKQMIEGVNPLQRRDISAPQLGQKAAVLTVNKGSASVGQAGRALV